MNSESTLAFKQQLENERDTTLTLLKRALLESNYECLQVLVNRIEVEPIHQWLDQIDVPHSSAISHFTDKLKQIESSLALIDTGMFGLCADCEAPIDYQVLLVKPWTQRCHLCQPES